METFIDEMWYLNLPQSRFGGKFVDNDILKG